MSEKIRAGLVGYGYASKTFHAPLIVATTGMELAAISSSDAAKVQADWPQIAVTDNPEALFCDPELDLIVIPTPNDTHFPLAKAALMAGKHVIVDKPFTVTLSQARELKALADHHKRLLSVFHNRRWDSDFLTLKALLNEGLLGDIRYFESRFDRFRPQVRHRWREMAGTGNGLWYDLGPHLLDQTLQLFGRPVAIHVDLAELRPGAQTVDYFHAVLTYPQSRVVLHASMLVAAPSPRYQVHGTHGSYIKYGLDPQEECLKAGEYPPQAEWGNDLCDGRLTLAKGETLTEKPLRTVSGNYPAYYAAICEAINGKADNPVTAQEAIQVMELIELGIQSAHKKQTLFV
ncbi:oxidoreductase [Enterobacteriaceae bacterium LUAb1]